MGGYISGFTGVFTGRFLTVYDHKLLVGKADIAHSSRPAILPLGHCCRDGSHLHKNLPSPCSKLTGAPFLLPHRLAATEESLPWNLH